jgi:hypothetical protein
VVTGGIGGIGGIGGVEFPGGNDLASAFPPNRCAAMAAKNADKKPNNIFAPIFVLSSIWSVPSYQ